MRHNVIGIYEVYKGTNNNIGQISIGPIVYNEEGIHYYQIKEVKGNEKINYDDTIYTVKTKVVTYNNTNIIESMELVNTADVEMNFYNTTIPEDQGDIDGGALKNPNTKDSIKIAFIVLLVIITSIYLIKKLVPRKYDVVS